jgi:Gas vesicle protein
MDALLSQRGPLAATTKTTAEVLERVLDKGILVIGDISVAILNIDLLTLKLRLAVMSLDRAIELSQAGFSPFGIPLFSQDRLFAGKEQSTVAAIEQRIAALESRLEKLEKLLTAGNRQALALQSGAPVEDRQEAWPEQPRSKAVSALERATQRYRQAAAGILAQ